MDIRSPEGLLIVGAIFLLGGFSKGVVGLGMPTIAVGLGTAVYGLETALALAAVPVIATNIWQGLAGGYFRELMKRLWLLLLTTAALAWVGTGILAKSDGTAIAGVLGVILVAYAVLGLTTPRISHPGRHEIWMTPVVGILTGFITGLTGSSVVPGVMYLQALDLGRDRLVQSMGILFTVSWSALSLALADNRLMSGETVGVSAAALVPAVAGMLIGQRIRAKVPERQFRTVFLSAILILGVYIAARAAVAL
ncbi:MAG: sulfite exporter TauE/SafE family protein [Alphaproteobacteria bacterium]